MSFQTVQAETDIDLTVKPSGKNSKDDIKQPELAEKNLIPRVNTSTIIVGRSGSGKSVVMSQLLNDPNFWGDTFDLVCLISPTAKMDDVQSQFPVSNEECVVTNLKKAPAFLQGLMQLQKENIEKYGAGNSPLVCIILDDCVADRSFINSNEFFEIFMKNRHYNFTVVLASQQYKSISKKARLQANNVIFFKSPDSETEHLVYDFCPPAYSRQKFMQLIKFATDDEYSFLYINMKAPWKERFRKNFSEIILL